MNVDDQRTVENAVNNVSVTIELNHLNSCLLGWPEKRIYCENSNKAMKDIDCIINFFKFFK